MSLSTTEPAVALPLRIEPTTVQSANWKAFTGLSNTTVYQLAAAGDIDLIKVGRVTLLDVASWRRYLARQPRAVIRRDRRAAAA